MNITKAEKLWRESCPEEADGLVSRRKKGNRWNKIVESAKARDKLKEKS